MRVEHTVTIDRPIAEVFRYAADPDNFPAWHASVRRVRRTSAGPLGVGATFDEVTECGGRRLEVSWEVTAYEPPRVLAYRAIGGPFAGAVRHLWSAVDSGTRLTLLAEAEPGGFGEPAAGVPEGALGRRPAADLAALKELLERRGTAREPADRR